MKMSPILFLHLIFLCLLDGHLSSNPDSVVVESPEDNNEGRGRVPAVEQEPKAFVSLSGPRVFLVRIMRPITVGGRVVWKEIRRQRVDRTRLSPFQSVLEIFGTGPSNSRRPTVKNTVTFRNITPHVENRPQLPENSVKGNNRRNSMTSKSPPVKVESDEDISLEKNPDNEVTELPRKVSPDSNFFAGIVNDFTFKLMENTESNFVVSPLSIFVALAMCYLGADGRTKTQMEQVMGMDDNAVHEEHLHKGIKDLISLVMEESDRNKLFVANGMFLRKYFTPEAKFAEDVKNYYNAEIKNLDFRNPSTSLQLINEWVANKTENMITSVFNEAPSPLTRLILYNAVYFKGTWKTSFPLHFTHPGKFQTLDGNSNEVEYMNIYNETFSIFRSDEHQHTFIKLPYEGEELSMVIALPYSESQKPMQSMKDEILCHMLDAMTDTVVDSVTIPKFRIDFQRSFVGPLTKLGISDIFDKNAVNLKKLRKENDVHVSDILHKAVVDVNEEGTTASAITSISFVPLSARKMINFLADHPFAFYIVHEPTGLVLFYGKKFDFN